MGRTFFTLLILFSVVIPQISWGQADLKPQLSTKIVYDASGKPKIEIDDHGQSTNDTATNKIQTSLMFYSYAMNQVPEAKRSAFLNQAQLIVTAVATEQGIKRANILKGNPQVQNIPSGDDGRGYNLTFGALGKKGNSLKVDPIGSAEGLLEASVFYVFQDTINTVPIPGLRLLALALGGTNKWYRELGKASDPNSVSQAPAYGLNLALDIISKLSGTKL